MKRTIPFGNRILVHRDKVGEKASKDSAIILSEKTAEATTDIATVVYIPERTFVDKELVKNATKIIHSLTEEAMKGSHKALDSLLEYNLFLKLKSIQPGDKLMISRYAGMDFYDNVNPQQLQTIVDLKDVIGVIIEGDDNE